MVITVHFGNYRKCISVLTKTRVFTENLVVMVSFVIGVDRVF